MWNHTTFHMCHSEVGALRVSVAEDYHLVIAKSTRQRRRQNRYRVSPWTYEFFGQLEDRAHDTLPVLIVIARAEASGVTPVPSKV